VLLDQEFPKDEAVRTTHVLHAKHFRAFAMDRFEHVRIHYRTPIQLGLLERLQQTLKHEEVYWRLYASPAEARSRLAAFMERYNTIRPHWALVPETGGDPVTPEDVYVHGVKPTHPKWQGWARWSRAEELFVPIPREAERYSEDTGSIQLRCPVVGAIVLLDGTEVDTAR